jgi:hypothetical protein
MHLTGEAPLGYSSDLSIVMPGLVPGIHVLQACGGKDRGWPGTAMTTIMKQRR